MLENSFKTLLKQGGLEHFDLLRKLRRFWQLNLSEAYARHSYPHRIRQETLFTIPDEVFTTSQANHPLNISRKKRFRQFEEMVGFIEQVVDHPLSADQQDFLYQHPQCRWEGYWLHLHVYDGRVMQAVQINRHKVIETVHEHFADVRLIDIECSVGNLKPVHQSRQICQELEEAWSTWFAENWMQWMSFLMAEPLPEQQWSLMVGIPSELESDVAKLLENKAMEGIHQSTSPLLRKVARVEWLKHEPLSQHTSGFEAGISQMIGEAIPEPIKRFNEKLEEELHTYQQSEFQNTNPVARRMAQRLAQDQADKSAGTKDQNNEEPTPMRKFIETLSRKNRQISQEKYEKSTLPSIASSSGQDMEEATLDGLLSVFERMKSRTLR